MPNDNNITTPPVRPLAQIQQLIADEVAHILVSGGHPEVTDLLLKTAYKHHQWRWAVYQYDGDDQLIELHMKGALDAPGPNFESWRDDLRAAWRAMKKTPPAELPMDTATQRVRNSQIERLRESFESFLVHATPEETWLLWDALTTHESHNLNCDNFEELPLAYAFETALANGCQDFLRVPESMRKTVKAYIAALQKAEIRDK
jgi:hypothetical protein